MRISTSQIFDAGTLGIQRNQFDLFKLQNQLSSGRRVLSPADDPVAAAQALIVTQSKEVNSQYLSNQKDASNQLGLVDNQLSALTNLIQNVRERVVQAGNTTLSNADRQSIASELEARLGELQGIANSQNGSGDYLFSGYQGATLPFAINGSGAVVPPATTPPFAYAGDDGERLLQVGASRQIGVNVAGSDLFMNIKNGNGTFVTAAAGNVAGGINQGAATIDAGSVLDSAQWSSALNGFAWSAPANPSLQIRFSVTAGATTYRLYDVSVPGTPVAVTAANPYTPGQAIPLTATAPAQNFGAQVVVSGQPSDNDTFTIKPSSNQSLFQTLQNLVGALRTPVGGANNTTTQFSSDLGAQLLNLDRSLDNVSRVQSNVGTRMRELDSLTSTAEDVDVQYQSALSGLQDLDYAAAISDFTKKQMQLEAAQKSFAQISNLGLFSYL